MSLFTCRTNLHSLSKEYSRMQFCLIWVHKWGVSLSLEPGLPTPRQNCWVTTPHALEMVPRLSQPERLWQSYLKVRKLSHNATCYEVSKRKAGENTQKLHNKASVPIPRGPVSMGWLESSQIKVAVALEILLLPHVCTVIINHSPTYSWIQPVQSKHLSREHGKLHSQSDSPVYSGTWTENTTCGFSCL